MLLKKFLPRLTMSYNYNINSIRSFELKAIKNLVLNYLGVLYRLNAVAGRFLNNENSYNWTV